MKKLSVISATLLALSLTACAGRAPQPIAVVQQKDTTMDCEAIQAEINQNNARSSDLGKEKGGKVAQNVVAAAAGVLFPPLWFMMDFQGAADTDQKAIDARNQYLSTMALRVCKDQPLRTVNTQ